MFRDPAPDIPPRRHPAVPRTGPAPAWAGAVAVLLILSCHLAFSATETFDYDAAGRLRRIRSDAADTGFTYDALGNLVAVRPASVPHPPQVLGVVPDRVRVGATTPVRVTGNHLAGARVEVPDPSFAVTGLSTAAQTLDFDLTSAGDAPLGTQAFHVLNADGNAAFALDVLPPIPQLSIAPLPLALPPDGPLRDFLVRLSTPDTVDHRVALGLSDPSLAALGTTEVLIPAGAVEARAGIRGLAPGITLLGLDSDGLEPRRYSVYVTADYGGANTALSRALGVQLGEPPGSGTPVRFDWSPLLGVAVGPHIEAVQPPALAVGTDNATLILSGAGLAGVNSLVISPPAGIGLDELQVAADGRSVAIKARVDAAAATGLRRVVLGGADGPYPPARPGADLLAITPPPPQLDSMAPLYGLRGSTGLHLTLRGRNLGQAGALVFNPPDGILVGSDLATGNDGSSLTATLSIAPDAPLGERVVRVTTPAGTSSPVASGRNSFRVADAVTASYDALVSPHLGLQVGEDTGTRPLAAADYAAQLGVTLGPFGRLLSPGHAERGSSLTLTVSGTGLAAVQSLALAPAAGATLGTPGVDADGRRLTVPLDLAADAPETWRRLHLYGPTGEIPFADPGAARFLVTGPVPVLTLVSPNTLAIGAGPRNLSLTGRHLDRAERVEALPAAGLTLGAPALSADGTRIDFSAEAPTGADPGPRVLVVTTPAGSSDPAATPGNTVTLHTRVLAQPAPLPAPLLGVTVGEDAAGGSFAAHPLTSPLLGVRVGQDATPAGFIPDLAAPALGVVLGPYLTAIDAPPLLPGDTYTLTLHGHHLEGLDGAAIEPDQDLSVGLPAPAADGDSALLSLTVPAGTPARTAALRLVAGPLCVPFTDPTRALLQTATAAPRIVSLSPIVIRPGETLALTVRGSHLENALRVLAEPAQGLQFSSGFSVAADGSELRISLHAADDATPGGRTLRVQTPGGTSTALAAPANTLTVY